MIYRCYLVLLFRLTNNEVNYYIKITKIFMKIKLLLIVCFLYLSMDVFTRTILSGKNSTSYDYKKHLAGNKFSFKSKTGLTMSSVMSMFFLMKVSYITSITLNQFNSFSINEATTPGTRVILDTSKLLIRC
jgi:hypothetical protein